MVSIKGICTADFKRLPRTIYAGLPSSLGIGVGGTVILQRFGFDCTP